MLSCPAAEMLALPAPAVSPAEILELHPRGHAARVRTAGDGRCRWARLAMPHPAALRPGATALLIAGQDDALYVIGVVRSPGDRESAGSGTQGGAAPEVPRAIRLECGTTAQVAGPPEAERLQVVSASGQLVFEYDPANRRTRLHVPSGDLQLVAPAGAIELIGQQGVRLHSGAAVEVHSPLAVRFEAGSDGEGRAELQLLPQTAHLSAPQLRLTAGQLDAAAGEVMVTAESLTARSQRTRLISQTLETAVDTLLESAKTIVRRVRGLFQLRAAQLHVAIEQHAHVQAERVVVKADEDVKILGEQIHLG